MRIVSKGSIFYRRCFYRHYEHTATLRTQSVVEKGPCYPEETHPTSTQKLPPKEIPQPSETEIIQVQAIVTCRPSQKNVPGYQNHTLTCPRPQNKMFFRHFAQYCEERKRCVLFQRITSQPDRAIVGPRSVGKRSVGWKCQYCRLSLVVQRLQTQ